MTYATRREFLGKLAFASVLPALIQSTSGVISSAAQLDKPDFGPVRNKILNETARGAATGVAVAVAHNGKIVWEEGFGWANREAAVKATSRTPFNLGSLTKPFTTTTLMTMVAEGKLSLDSPANNYLPKSKIVGTNGSADAATVRRLGAHVSGLPTMFAMFDRNEANLARSPEALLTEYGSLAYPPGLARFSPDGRYLAYVLLDQANQAEVFVRPVDAPAGTKPWQISEGASSGPFWRRDGKALYYLARDQSVMAAEVSTSGEFTFKKPEVLYRQQSPVPDRISYISADGDRFVVLPRPRGPQLQQITIFNREGQAVKKVGEPGRYSAPSFSPDATRLLVTKNDLKTGQQDLWTIDLATGKSTQITNDTFLRFGAMWWPDGQHIFYSSLRNGDFAIYRKGLDGSGSEEILSQYTPGAGVFPSDVSPDGQSLIFESGGVILTVPLTGSDAKSRTSIETLREEFDDETGRVSPDGRFLLYRSDEKQAERYEVYVRPFDPSTGKVGEQEWQVSKDGAGAMLHWRGDGKEVFFRGLNLDSNELYVMAAEVGASPAFHAGTPRMLFKLPGPLDGSLGNISRDGQQFVFAIDVPAASGTR